VRQHIDKSNFFLGVRIAGLNLDKLSAEVYNRIPIPSNVHGKMIEVAKNDAPFISATFTERQLRLRETTYDSFKAMDMHLKRDEASRGINSRMRWMKKRLEDALNLKEKVTLFLDKNMPNELYSIAYSDLAERYEQSHVDEMALYRLFLKVSRIADVENRQFFQLLAKGFAAQTLDVSCAVCKMDRIK
jgi:hypothetical protein